MRSAICRKDRMKTIRNFAVAALLTFAAVVMNQQSAYAYDPADACQGPNPESQCSTVSGGHAYMTGYSECVWSSYAEGPVWRSDFECRLGDDVYSTGNCFEYFPSGNPQYCG